jgi:hypothetical protein
VADVRRLVGIDVGVLDDDLLTRALGCVGGKAEPYAPRSRRMLMYPLPATSIDFTPGMGPISSTSSAAIFLGACRNCLASWKAAGTAISPKSLCRGCSTLTASSMP